MIAAFFDVDGTLARTTTLHPLAWYQRGRLAPRRFQWWLLGLYLQIPSYWLIDRISRRRFNEVFYRRYAGLPADDLRDWHRAHFADTLQKTLFPGALACVEEHRKQGHQIVLLTGALDWVMAPLADYLGAEHLIASQLQVRDGICTGKIAGPPLTGAEKARRLQVYAEMHGIDLPASFAYGDSYGDVPMLSAVGRAVAVRPDRRLRRQARRRGWRIVAWAED